MKPVEQRTPKISKTSLVEYAIRYAQNGWYVFPLHGKIPYNDSNGHKDAKTDPLQIQAWWSLHPTANIGLATGERSGIIVLDIDVPNGYFHLKELQQRYSPLPDTRRVRTANKGLHYYFQYPNTGITLPNAVALSGLKGIDIRGEGGYVVLPPSTLFNRLSYTWGNPDTPIAQLPQWLRQLILDQHHVREDIPQPLRFTESPGDKWLTRALQKAGEGNRNAIGFWLACQLRDDHIPEDTARSILLTYANSVPNGAEHYSPKEALASVRSAYKRPPREPARKR